MNAAKNAFEEHSHLTFSVQPFDAFRVLFLCAISVGFIYAVDSTVPGKYHIIEIELSGFVLYLISRARLVTYRKSGNDEMLSVKGIFFGERMHGPFEVKTWWNYDNPAMFKVPGLNTKTTMRNTVSVITVWSKFTNGEGRGLVFYEPIKLDGRFPNTRVFDEVVPHPDLSRIMVLNVDKLLSALKL